MMLKAFLIVLAVVVCSAAILEIVGVWTDTPSDHRTTHWE